MSKRTSFIRCIRPFEEVKCSKELRHLSDSTIVKLNSLGYPKASELRPDSRICSSCRLHIDKHAGCISKEEQNLSGSAKISTTAILPGVSSSESLATVPSATSVATVESNEEFSQPVNVDIFNRGIAGIQVSPIDLGKLNYVYYPENKYREITAGIRKNLFKFEPETEESNEFNEVIQNMKDKYSTSTRSEKLLILSLLPKSWSTQKIIDQFSTTRYMATEAKETKDNGHSSKSGRYSTALSDETKEAVIRFFEDDDISRAMPGQKDYVSVQKEGKRQAVQKRLLMMTLREAYKHFNEIHDNAKIGFSSFAKLRPKNCKLLTSSGTHNVCVCTTHENINLILHSLKKLNLLNDLKTLTYSLLCQNNTTYCYLRCCNDCPDSSSLEEYLLKQLEEKSIDQISFEQWITTDRCDIETIVKPSDEFVSFFCLKLVNLIPHDFIKTEQSNFLKKKREITCKKVNF